MDTEQFDRLAKALSSATDRRHLVTGVGASLLAGLFGVEASAGKRKRHHAKPQHHRKHGGDQNGKNKQGADQEGTKRRVKASDKKCGKAGHPCEGKQDDRCCEGLVCRKSGRGSARRCTACPDGTVSLDGTCCTPDNAAACAGKTCGDARNNCDQTVSCGDPCPPPPGGCPAGTVTCGSECFPACCPGTTESCYSGPAGTASVGVCQAGVRQCTNAGTWGPCAGEITPSAESCDGLDNDCDGVVDNGFNLQNDVNHCGSCGHVCPTGMECEHGRCTAICSSVFACDCSNLNNCSGNGCCTESCTCFCDEDWTGADCTIPRNLQVCDDVDHVCPEGWVCQQGECKAVCESEFACDCSNLNSCSGHGCCTETCSCRCDQRWFGADCSLPL